MPRSQRGYNFSDKPSGVSRFRLTELATDVLHLMDEVAAHEAFVLVGHDWGGGFAWWITHHYPERMRRLVVRNAPHPAALREHLRRRPTQVLRSSTSCSSSCPVCRSGALLAREFRGSGWAAAAPRPARARPLLCSMNDGT